LLHHGGDAVLATFNVPVEDAAHAANAFEAARAILACVAERKFAEERIQVRIGINTGSLVAGHVGGGGRQSYTVHGDAVNLAARLEALCKECVLAAPQLGCLGHDPHRSLRAMNIARASTRRACCSPPGDRRKSLSSFTRDSSTAGLASSIRHILRVTVRELRLLCTILRPPLTRARRNHSSGIRRPLFGFPTQGGRPLSVSLKE
jgi:hypothetical protein